VAFPIRAWVSCYLTDGYGVFAALGSLYSFALGRSGQAKITAVCR
jgi:hypothetical protein